MAFELIGKIKKTQKAFPNKPPGKDIDAALVEKIKQTQNVFPAQQPSAVLSCPMLRTEAKAPPAPVDVKTVYGMTQKIMKTLGANMKPPPPKQQKKAWIEIVLVDAEGKPMPGVRYRITPPDGAPVEGRLNEHGQAGVYQIDPGNCKISFPDLDKEAWD